MNRYIFEFGLEMPKYIQISRHIKKLIDSSAIEDGEKLPSIRELANNLSVNTVTIVNAYKKLQNEGYTFQKIGSGTYAKRKDSSKNVKKHYSDTFKALSSNLLKDYIDFTGETTCSDFFPVLTFKNVLNQVLDRDGADALVYQEVLGFKGLRETINRNFWNSSTDIEAILIVSGAQQGIDIASKALINVNDNVIVEKPTYGGALSVFKGRRANIFEVDIMNDGIDLIQFEVILKKNKIKCFYTMSYFQNPTGNSYNLETKKQILYLAEIYDFYIIEDDYLSELIYSSEIKYYSFKSLDDNDRVIYIKSFSKIFLPGIRIGYLISPKKFLEQIQNSKINTDIATSSLMQRALELYINRGYWKEHISYLNVEYKKRYEYMIFAMETNLDEKIQFHRPGGGLNFYLKINDKINLNCKELFYKCKKEKVLITPGVLFYKNSWEGEKHFRIGFSQVSNDKILKGIIVLSKVLGNSIY